MSIKYCGIFTDSKDFTCLGENEDEKFKKFVVKHQSAIIKEPMSKKIDINMGFFLTFLKFDGKIICTVGNAKYKHTKEFIEAVVDAITKFENKTKENPSLKVDSFTEYSSIIDLKLQLCDVGETSETMTETHPITAKKSLIPEGVNFQTSTLRKSVFLEGSVNEQVSPESKNTSKTPVPYSMPVSNILNEEGDTVCDVLIQPKIIPGSVKRATTKMTKDVSVNDVNPSVKHLPTQKNKNKLIELINNDVNDIKVTTKKNIMEVIKNQEDLSVLLMQSNTIKDNAMEYKENAKELKKETNRQLCLWSLVVGLVTFALVWMVCGIVLCGNPINPLCHI